MKKNNRVLYINGRFLTQTLTGVNRFAFEICKEMNRQSIDFVILTPKNVLPDYDISKFKILRIGILSSHLWDQVSLPLYLLKKKKYILMTFTGLGPVVLKRHIATVHDLAFLENPEWYSKPYYLLYKLLTPILVRNACKILTVSEFSKNEIIKYYDVNPTKIAIAHNAVSEELSSTYHINATEKYILAVSSLDPRKNFVRLVEAFQKANLNEVKLYIIGKSNRVFNQIKLNNDNLNIVQLGYVSDIELKKYYSHAIAFVYPSLYEGFGIPPLEALSNKCPSIVSNISVFKEIYGDSVLYADPYDVNDIANKIKKIVNNDSLRTKLLQKSASVLECYSWKRTVSVIKRTLNEIV